LLRQERAKKEEDGREEMQRLKNIKEKAAEK
jgi:hypothetical protein